MNKWSIKDVLFTIFFYTLIILAIQFLIPIIARAFKIDTITVAALIAILSAIVAAPLVYHIKAKDKRIWIAELIIFVVFMFFYIYITKPSRFGFVPYNEGIAVRIWIYMLSNIGVLIGSVAGYILWYFTAKKKI